MKRILCRSMIMAAILSLYPVQAQDSDAYADADYLAGAETWNYNQNQGRPVIGLTHKADFIVVTVSFISDTRDAMTRTQEINSMLSAALDRARAAGLELGFSTPVLRPVTKANYMTIPTQWAGREDTSKVDILVKVPMAKTVAEVDAKVDAFVKALPRSGRGTIIKNTGRQLALRNPEQYRGAIVSAIAEDVRRNAEAFGPDYRGAIDGLDKPVQWVQTNETDVFLYLPYSYRIVAK